MDERFKKILLMLEESDVISVASVASKLSVTEMTVRRDLKILESQNKLVRIHGGAKAKLKNNFVELSHFEKQNINVDEKRYIAKLAAKLIHENDTVFIGAGTTNEMIYEFIDVKYAKVITNSFEIFIKFKQDSRFETILIGGKLRERTGAFVGSLSNEIAKKINVNKAFIGANGIIHDRITTFNEDEGSLQAIMLDNANERYILADSSKIGKTDFFVFYNVKDVTAIVTGKEIGEKISKDYAKLTKIIRD